MDKHDLNNELCFLIFKWADENKKDIDEEEAYTLADIIVDQFLSNTIKNY